MSTYNTSPAFQDAAGYLSSASSLSKVSTAIKLELYGLFKYLTVSPAPSASRPSIFDMTGRAKWDAWSAASNVYGDRREKAEKRYLEIARDLGWTESIALPMLQNQSHTESDKVIGSSEDSWKSHNNESGSNRGEGGNGGSGMGTSVSAMAPPPLDDQDARSLHGLAVANKASELSSHLDASPGDINKLDEHGYTSLHLACDRGNTAVVKLLLHRGADYSLKDPDDFTALELATVAGHDDIVALIGDSR